MISAEVICDSISQQHKRLTTFRLRYPKFIHSEFMTHRKLSRNASSSRAIPSVKLIDECLNPDTRAAPASWGRNAKGMQAREEFTGDALEEVKAVWDLAASSAAQYARIMDSLGAHKQIVNRILEPYTHIKVISSATEWDNFFGLRLHVDADPTMRALAIAMWEARKESIPTLLLPGDWHLPYIEFEDKIATVELCNSISELERMRIKISVARCARVSYQSFDNGKRSTIEEDLAFYSDKLHLPLPYEPRENEEPIHASPAEHQATPDDWVASDKDYPCDNAGWQHPEEHGNYVGWRQYRKSLRGEDVAPLPEEFCND